MRDPGAERTGTGERAACHWCGRSPAPNVVEPARTPDIPETFYLRVRLCRACHASLAAQCADLGRPLAEIRPNLYLTTIMGAFCMDGHRPLVKAAPQAPPTPCPGDRVVLNVLMDENDEVVAIT